MVNISMLFMPPAIVQEAPSQPAPAVTVTVAAPAAAPAQDPASSPARPIPQMRVQFAESPPPRIDVIRPSRHFDTTGSQPDLRPRVTARVQFDPDGRQRMRATAESLTGAVFGPDYNFVDEDNFTGVERDLSPGSNWRFGIGEIESETPPALREEHGWNNRRDSDMYGVRFRLTLGPRN